MSTAANAVGFSFVKRLAQDLKDERLELPAFPEAVLRIQRMLQSPDTSTDAVVRVIGSEPALAAQLLRMANSVQFRRLDNEVTDLKTAVARMGFNVVRSVAVAFALRQLRRKDSYSAAVQQELETVWHRSLEIAALCFVLAQRFTRINPDQALLTGLLHMLGRLYITMRMQDMPALSATEMQDVIGGWHATIGKAILESWGLPEPMQHAIEHQDDLEIALDGNVTLTDLLIAAKLVALGEREAERYPALARVGGGDGTKVIGAAAELEEEIAKVRGAFGT